MDDQENSMNNDNGNNMNRRDGMVVDGDESCVESAAPVRMDDRQRSMMIQQTVQEQFREMERVTCELKVLSSKLQNLCWDLDDLRGTTLDVSTTATTEINNHRRCIGDETQHLSHLAFELGRMQHKWESGLRLVKNCVSIRNNDINGIGLESYHEATRPMPSGRFLSDLLSHNTSVRILSLHMNTLVEPQAVDDLNRAQQDLKGVLHSLETSHVLRHLSLLCDDPTPQAKALAALCLDAIRRNPNIVDMDLELQIAPAMALYDLLSTTTMIRSFDVQCSHRYSDAERSKIERAFASNRSVTSLTLHAHNADDDDDDWSLIRNVVYTLPPRGGQMPLQVLSLHDDYVSVAEMQCVSHFLRHTTTLQHLEFAFFRFNDTNMECLLDGLQQHYTAPEHRSSLTKFTLNECTYSVEAGRKFLRFMQSTQLYTNRTSGAAMLEELNVGIPRLPEMEEDVDDVNDMMLGDLPNGIAMASIVLPLSEPTEHGTEIQLTVGSQLQVLSLKPLSTMIGFCDQMTLNATVIQLPQLHLSGLGNKEWMQLANLIPKLKSLRELNLRVDNNTVTPNEILAVIRETDHLHALSVMNESWEPLFNDSEFELAQALCQRNTILSSMLSRKVHWHWDSHWSARPRHHKRPKTQHCNLETDDDVVVFPMLLQAAKQVPSTRVSTVLCALLVFEVECSGT